MDEYEFPPPDSSDRTPSQRGNIAALLMAGSLAQADIPAAPVARVEPVIDTHWGVEVHDQYRYMENMRDDYVQGWFRAQAAHASAILSALPGRDALLARLHELNAGKPYRSYAIRRLDDGSVFYIRQAADENLGKLYRVDAKTGEQKLLVDPDTMRGNDEQHYSLETYVPSPDGRYVVYGIAQGGSEETVYHTLEVSSGKHIGAAIERVETAYNRPQWHPDGDGFFYSRRQTLPASAPETDIYKKTQVRFHRLGTDPAHDPVIAGYGVSKQMPLSDVDFPSIVVGSSSNHALIKIKHGDSNELTLYSAPVNSLFETAIPWRQICTVDDAVTDFAVHGDDIYLMSADKAPRFKIVRTSLRKPDFATTATVVPVSNIVIDTIVAARDALYAGIMEDGISRLLRIQYRKQPDPVRLKLPNDAAAYISSVSATLDGIDVYANSWIKGSLIYRYHPKTGHFTDTGLLPKGSFDELPGYTATEVLIKSHDGVMVPLSIIHRSDLKLDGQNPTLLTGYGSYSISMNVLFNPLQFAWLERGGVYAVAHVRGGGEYGQAWHYAGRMLNKPNSWKDFIASAEYLIKEGYTAKTHIAGMGGSAGGILVGRAITERPDLFAAAVIRVGMTDTIRAETTTNGVPNIQEFGTVKEKDGFHGLMAMSPYHHVRDGVKYPAVLLTHGINDPRVDPWMSGKMTARLQAATASDGPVLLRVDYDAGHGIGSTRDQRLQEQADIYSFLFWQLTAQSGTD